MSKVEAKSKKCNIKFDNAFIESYLFCESANIWLGKPMCVQSKPYFKKLDQEGRERGERDLGHQEIFILQALGKSFLKMSYLQSPEVMNVVRHTLKSFMCMVDCLRQDIHTKIPT